MEQSRNNNDIDSLFEEQEGLGREVTAIQQPVDEADFDKEAGRDDQDSQSQVSQDDDFEQFLDGRYKDALKLHDDGPLFVPLGDVEGAVCNLQSDNTTSSTEARYKLRPDARNKLQPQCHSWVDEDQTGNFDPSSKFPPELEASRFPEKPKRPALDPACVDSRREKRPRAPHTTRFARWNGLQKVFSITFSDLRCRQMLRDLKKDEAALCDQGSRTRGEDHWPVQLKDKEDNFTELSPKAFLDNRLRSRALSTDHIDAIDIQNGDPKARGCKRCLRNNEPCTLIGGSSYPCQCCLDENEQCDPVTEPAQKAKCENCKSARGAKCSFQDSPFMRGPCSRCKENGELCIAGPLSGYTRSHCDLDTDPTEFMKREAACKKKGNTLRNCRKDTGLPTVEKASSHSDGPLSLASPERGQGLEAAHSLPSAWGSLKPNGGPENVNMFHPSMKRSNHQFGRLGYRPGAYKASRQCSFLPTKRLYARRSFVRTEITGLDSHEQSESLFRSPHRPAPQIQA